MEAVKYLFTTLEGGLSLFSILFLIGMGIYALILVKKKI